MPPDQEPGPLKSLDEIVDAVALYPREAYKFLQAGLQYTVDKLHGEREDPTISRHVSGQQLCEGLREYALLQWGMLARTVLERWNIHETADFGRIVFALVDHGHMSKTEEDSLDDFRNVFDFSKAFEHAYKIECQS